MTTCRLKEGALFLVAAGPGPRHVAAPDFVPTSWGEVEAESRCGEVLLVVGSANYSSNPCPLCLEISRHLVR